MTGSHPGPKPIIGAAAIRRAIGGERRLPKRFYESVAIAAGDSGLEITLDGRAVRTPLTNPLSLPTRALADGVAAEWSGQGEFVDPATMPLTRLANTAIDRVVPRLGEVVGEIVSYADTDLVCYRAAGPDGLVLRQAQHWGPIVERIERELGCRLVLIQGVVHHAQPAETIARFTDMLALYGPFMIAGIHNLTTLTGSALIAEAVASGFVGAEAAWAAAHVDEDWQIEQWGSDAEAQALRSARRAEFTFTARFTEMAAR